MQVHRTSKAKLVKFLLSIIACNESSISRDDPESKQATNCLEKERFASAKKITAGSTDSKRDGDTVFRHQRCYTSALATSVAV